MSLELIYFKACPFAQRVLVALEQLELGFQKTLINPMDKPAWMFEVTPMGQIPLLRVGGHTVLFDSSVICEFLNDVSSSTLLPENPLARGQYRGLVEFAGECQMNFGGLIAAPDEEKFRKAQGGLLKKLNWLEGLVDENGPLFAGAGFSMVDAAFAPLFLRMQHLQKVVSFYKEQDLPRISRWSGAVLAEKSVEKSVDGDFSMIFKNVVQGRGKGGFVHQHMQ
jgi:glutathione S-transferase